MVEHELTSDRLRAVLQYDAETGLFRWLEGRHVGTTAGWIDEKGYRVISVDGCRYRAHRLVWFYVHGRWPKVFVDHANRSRDDNRLSNLREANHSQNSANRIAQKGRPLKGITRDRGNRWRAQICRGGRNTYIGVFSTAEEAHAAYVKAAKIVFGEFARAA